jgi:hypothetical protein
MADSQALKDLRKGLVAVDDVLGFVKQTAGKPSKPEKSLFVASVALSYAMWENYVEDVAIEVTTFLSEELPPALVPDEVRDAITKAHPNPWDIAVHPGWRALWWERRFGLAPLRRLEVAPPPSDLRLTV